MIFALSGAWYTAGAEDLTSQDPYSLLTLGPQGAPGGESGTTLSAIVTETSNYTRTYNWDINKSVTPETWNIFQGDTATSQYNVNVTKKGYTDEAVIEGNVTVTNGGGVATQNLVINLNLTEGPGFNNKIGTYTVDVSSHPVLAPGETWSYPYKIVLTGSQIYPGENYKVTADVTILNHSGHLGVPFGPNPSNTTILPGMPTPVNDVIHVDDTNGGSWIFSDTNSTTYNKTFNAAGTFENTATILETGQSASASVTVNNYVLDISKTAGTAFDRIYNWTINKTGNETEVITNLGGSVPVNYNVEVGVDQGTDSNWAVNGTINITNNAPIAANITNITDVVSPDIVTSITDLPSFPYTLQPGETLLLHYNASLPDAAIRTNNATLTQQNYDYSYIEPPKTIGTTNYSATADVIFGSTPTQLIDESIDVYDDTFGLFLGTVTVGENITPSGSFSFPSYSTTYGPFLAPGDYSETNTASFITNDTKTRGNDSWTVIIHVKSSYGTLTIGYWKTHAGFTGNNPDNVTKYLPIWLGKSTGTKSVQVTNASQAVSILQMNGTASNGINKLYAQLLATKLNIANGADDSSINLVISASDDFLAIHNANDWNTLTKAQKTQVLVWMNALDSYNNGI
jgi:hypothetical protein